MSTGDILRSCKGQKDSDESEFSGPERAVYSPRNRGGILLSDSGVGFFAATQDHSTLLHLSKRGEKKANTGISELVVHYAPVLRPVSSVATYHSVAGARVPAGGGPGAFCSCWSADQFVFFNMTIVAAKPDNEKLKVK